MTTTEPHPHIQFVLDGHDALEAKDFDRIKAMFTPDIVWHEFGTPPFGGSYRGLEAVMGFWKTYLTAAGEGLRQDISSIMANDDFVTTIVQLAIPGEPAHEQTALDLMKMRDGRIAEFWRYYEDLGAFHAALQRNS